MLLGMYSYFIEIIMHIWRSIFAAVLFLQSLTESISSRGALIFYQNMASLMISSFLATNLTGKCQKKITQTVKAGRVQFCS